MIRVQAGDQQAFAELFARYRSPVWSWLYRRSHDRESTSELYQEVFLRVWRSATSHKPGQPVRPWIWRIAANVARDRFRKAQRGVELADGDVESYGQRQDPAGFTDLERAVGRLPEPLRDAFLLCAVHGLDHNEVAQILEISPANVRQRVARARATLRDVLIDGAAS
jgi:RNA polymerase sigma-70 factor (ECF subfamily)